MNNERNKRLYFHFFIMCNHFKRIGVRKFNLLRYNGFTNNHSIKNNKGGCRGRDRMVVEFTSTYAISAYHHWCEFESRSGQGVQHYVIKFVSDLWQVCDITEILLKVALNTIKKKKTIKHNKHMVMTIEHMWP